MLDRITSRLERIEEANPPAFCLVWWTFLFLAGVVVGAIGFGIIN